MRARRSTLPELQPEDALRLEALARLAEAVRIDEGRGEVRGLVGAGTRTVRLAGGGSFLYLEAVRDLLARVAVGDPALRRGPLRRPEIVAGLGRERLAALPRLGDPELVVMMPLSAALDLPLARTAWWAAPGPALAGLLLAHPAVAGTGFAAEVSAHLLEHLPFVTEADERLRLARALLAGGGLGTEGREVLVRRGRRDPALRTALLEEATRALEADTGGERLQAVLRDCVELLAVPEDRIVTAAVLAVAARLLPGDGRVAAAQAALARAGADGTVLARRMAPLLHPVREALAALGGLPAPEPPSPGRRRRRR